MAKVKAYYDHNLSGLTASATATGYSVDNLLIFLESSLWKGVGTGDHTITFDAGVGNTVTADYVGVANHNLSGTTFKLQYRGGEVTGSDLVGNGGFTSDASEWIASASTLASVAGGQSGNCLEITNSGAASGSAYQDIVGLTIGETYQVLVYFKKGTGASGAIKIGTTTDDDYYGINTGLTDVTWVKYQYDFTAETTTVRISLINESTIISETALFDSVSMKIASWADAVSFSPADNFPFLKEFTTQDKRFWRIQLTALTSVPFMGIAYWGDRAEWDYPALFDPDNESNKAKVNISPTGYLLGINNKYIERSINLKFKRADDGGTLWTALRNWWENHGLNLLFIAWDIDNHPNDIYLVYPDPKFRGPFTTANRREVTLTFKGRVAR
jgi:hypothetical protein